MNKHSYFETLCQSKDYLHSSQTASYITAQDLFLTLGNCIDDTFDPTWGHVTRYTDGADGEIPDSMRPSGQDLWKSEEPTSYHPQS